MCLKYWKLLRGGVNHILFRGMTGNTYVGMSHQRSLWRVQLVPTFGLVSLISYNDTSLICVMVLSIVALCTLDMSVTDTHCCCLFSQPAFLEVLCHFEFLLCELCLLIYQYVQTSLFQWYIVQCICVVFTMSFSETWTEWKS